MKKILISSALAAIISTSALAANNYTKDDTFNASITFAQAITVSILDLTIVDAVGGDTINNDMAITINRNVTCTIDDDTVSSSSQLTLTEPGNDTFTLGVALDNAANCTELQIDGTLPVDAVNDVAYTGSMTLTVAYDLTTHQE